MDKQLLGDVVEIGRKGNRISLAKLILGRKILHIINFIHYKLDLISLVCVDFGQIQMQWWHGARIPIKKKFFVGGDLNIHAETSCNGVDIVDGGFGFGEKNKIDNSILDLLSLIANTRFRREF